MPYALLYDSVTLRHFASVGRLDVLEARHGYRPEPHWTEAVQTELQKGHEVGEKDCSAVLAATWLGEPVIPDVADQTAILPIWIGLNDGRRPPKEHAGEAESIYFAETIPADFATDDGPAYDFAVNRLGVGRVVDTVEILRDAVAMGEINATEARDIANGIRDAGRYLRPTHPDPVTSDYF